MADAVTEVALVRDGLRERRAVDGGAERAADRVAILRDERGIERLPRILAIRDRVAMVATASSPTGGPIGSRRRE